MGNFESQAWLPKLGLSGEGVCGRSRDPMGTPSTRRPRSHGSSAGSPTHPCPSQSCCAKPAGAMPATFQKAVLAVFHCTGFFRAQGCTSLTPKFANYLYKSCPREFSGDGMGTHADCLSSCRGDATWGTWSPEGAHAAACTNVATAGLGFPLRVNGHISMVRTAIWALCHSGNPVAYTSI